MGNCLWRYFMLLFISLAFGKCNKVFNRLKIILVLEFCPWKTKISYFPVRFVLKKLKNQLRITCATGISNLENSKLSCNYYQEAL